MRTLASSVILSALLAASAVLSEAADLPAKQPPRTPARVADEVLVRYRRGVSAMGESRLHDRMGASLKRRIRLEDGSEYHQLKLRPGQSVDQALESLRADPDVAEAQPNFIYRISATPNDTYFPRQWGATNTAQRLSVVQANDALLYNVTFDAPVSTDNPGVSGKDMRLSQAWDLVTDCSSVIVAVADTGISASHADLAANMWGGNADHGYNAITSGASAPADGHGHGTHVAGTIGAVGNNGVGVAGVCWSVKLMAIKVLADNGSGTTTDIISGISWASAHGAKVLNMSLGGGGFDSAFQTAITNAANAGMLVVVAAGNDASDNEATPVYPCNYSNVLCVASLDQAYQLSDFSNYGSAHVHVGAPGTNIVSTWPGSVSITNEDISTWTTGGNFTYSTTLSSGTLGTGTGLVCPTNYNGTNLYASNENSKVYKSFNFSGKTGAALEVNWTQNTSTTDFTYFNYKSAGGDPFSAGTSYFTDSSGNPAGQTLTMPVTSFINYTFDMSDCLSATCSFGINLKSNGGTNKGVHIRSVRSKSFVAGTGSGYNVISGTSMATPHVAGLAALVMAYHPSYTASDVANAIKNGGVTVSALSGKTSTGKAADAYGALTYVAPPTGVVATAE